MVNSFRYIGGFHFIDFIIGNMKNFLIQIARFFVFKFFREPEAKTVIQKFDGI